MQQRGLFSIAANQCDSNCCSTTVAHSLNRHQSWTQIIDCARIFEYCKANHYAHQSTAHSLIVCRQPEVFHQMKHLFIEVKMTKSIFHIGYGFKPTDQTKNLKYEVAATRDVKIEEAKDLNGIRDWPNSQFNIISSKM